MILKDIVNNSSIAIIKNVINALQKLYKHIHLSTTLYFFLCVRLCIVIILFNIYEIMYHENVTKTYLHMFLLQNVQ